MATPNEPDMPSKRTEKVRLGIYRTQTRPNKQHIADILIAIDSKYGESNDSSENSVFLLLHQKDPFGELFSGIIL